MGAPKDFRFPNELSESGFARFEDYQDIPNY